MLIAIRKHWPEYLMEAAGVGFLMLSITFWVAVLDYPASPLHSLFGEPLIRRFIKAIAIGCTFIAIIYSPWGKQSGGHYNPSITLTFYRLGKVELWDPAFYILFQFSGGIFGVTVALALIKPVLSQPIVPYLITKPGMYGMGVAFLGEVLIAFILMMVILKISDTPELARHTGMFASFLIATYILIEAPLSGTSLNPARSFAAAWVAQIWSALWIYLIAPPFGMLLAGELYQWRKGPGCVKCAKLHHQNSKRCIFKHCGYRERDNTSE